MTPRRLLLTFVALVGLGAAFAARTNVSTNLLDALPTGGGFAEAYADAQRFSLLDTILVDIDGAARPDALAATIDALGARLEGHPELFSVRYRVTLADAVAIRTAAAPHLAVLVDEGWLRERTTPAGLAVALQGAAARLTGPTGGLVARLLPVDPLDLSGAVTSSLQAAGASEGVRVVGGHFLDATGTHGLLLVRSKGQAFGTTRASPLYTTLDTELAASPLPARWLGSARFAAEAREMIQGETQLAVGAGVALVAAVFLVAFRSVRPLLGTLPPALLGAALAGAAASFCSPVHGLTLAFGGALAGLGVDYWIHLYLHALKDGAAPNFVTRLAQGRDALRHLGGAYTISVLATVTSFGMLVSSAYPAVSDLGVVGIGAVLGALASVVLVGPLLYATLARPGDRVPSLPVPERVPAWLGGVGIAGLVALAAVAVGVRFDGDPRSLDARTAPTAALEAELDARWMGGAASTAALVVAEGASLDDALAALSPAVAALYAGAPGVQVQSPLGVLAGPVERQARAAVLADIARIAADFTSAADAAGFDAPSLLPGLRATLTSTSAPSLATWAETPVAELLGRTVRVDDAGRATVAALLRAMSPGALRHARYEVELSGADVRFIHPAGLAEVGAAQIRSELVTRSGLALGLVLLYLALRFRDPVRVLAAALPSLAAVAGTLGCHALLGQALTPVSGPALVLVLGLAFDQGIFLVEGEEGGRSSFLAARAAILVALANAFAGFAGLLAASHPAVRGVGLVVTLGIASTALGAFVLTPAVLRSPTTTRRWLRRSALAVVGFVILDQALALAGRITPPAVTLPAQHQLDPRSPTDRRFGPNRITREHGIWVATLSGTPTEIGEAAAHLSGPIRDRAEADLYRTFTRLVPNRFVQYGLARGLPFVGRAIATDSPPAYLEELAAYTQIGSDPWRWLTPTYTRKLMMHALHDVGQAMVGTPLLDGCTGFVAGGEWTRNGHWLLARNWDFGGGDPFSEDKAVVAVSRDGAIPYVSVAMMGLAGVVSGVNEAGIGIALQAAASDSPVRPGTPMIFIAREVLDSARSLDEAEAILRSRAGFVSEAVLVVDGEAGEAAIFEVTPDGVERLPAGTHLAQSNHLRGSHAGDTLNVERMAHGSTVVRLERMQALLDERPVDIERAVQLLRDRGGFPDGDERSINADIAAHGVVIDATARSITVGAWPNVAGEFVTFRLADLLAGELEGTVAAPADDPVRSLRVHLERERAGGVR